MSKRAKRKAEERDFAKIIENQTRDVKWFIGIGISIFAILTTLVLGVFYFFGPLGKGIKTGDLIKRYDPIFRSVLLDKAYKLLSDVHLTEIKTKHVLSKNISEIKNSLEMVDAFNNTNAGLLKILELVESIANGKSTDLEKEFLTLNPLGDNSLQMTPQEAGFLITFQGLLYLKELRDNENIKFVDQYLANAKNKFLIAKKLNIAISNMWNGLGICMMEEAHNTGNLTLINESRRCFLLAFELHRSPINLAAEINNLANVDLTITFHNTMNVIINEEEGSLILRVKNVKKIDEMLKLLEEALNSIETALMYDQESLSIQLSKAEVLCNMALLTEAKNLDEGDKVNFSSNDSRLEQAMEIIKSVHLKGFDNWAYLFSRFWISHTLLRIEKYRKDLINFVNP